MMGAEQQRRNLENTKPRGPFYRVITVMKQTPINYGIIPLYTRFVPGTNGCTRGTRYVGNWVADHYSAHNTTHFPMAQKIVVDSTKMEIYERDEARRTLRFLVSVAAQLACPNRVLIGGQTVGSAYAYAFSDGTTSTEDIDKVKKALAVLISGDLEISHETRSFDEACREFEEHRLVHSLALLRSRVNLCTKSTSGEMKVAVHSCGGAMRLALHALLPRTSALANAFPTLAPLGTGLMVSFQPNVPPSPTLTKSMADHKAWSTSLGVTSAGQLNELKGVGRELTDFTLHAEFRQEAILAALASAVDTRCTSGDESQRVGVVCIAGPTSSGKTTFATKLAMYLRNKGYISKALTVDHYYLPLDRQPKYQPRKLRSDVRAHPHACPCACARVCGQACV